jgi:hypothetical protein
MFALEYCRSEVREDTEKFGRSRLWLIAYSLIVPAKCLKTGLPETDTASLRKFESDQGMTEEQKSQSN